MNIAVIPPPPSYESMRTHLRPTQMFLSLTLEPGREITQLYQRVCQARGTTVILDTGAFERNPRVDLWERALEAGPDVVVVPDVLDERVLTINLAREWIKELDRFRSKIARILVPHGKSYASWKDCAAEMAGLARGGDLIGVYEEVDRFDPEGRIPVLEWLDALLEPLSRFVGIHMLGMPERLTELALISARVPRVVSCDGSKPIVYALNDIVLRYELDEPIPPYPGRPEYYFRQRLTPMEIITAHHNIAIVDHWARGETP